MKLDECVKLLDQSLIYHATLGGKELSHSNIVAALAKKYPMAFTQFIAPFFNVPSETIEIQKIQRESRNLDINFTLRIGSHDGGLTIENKLKAVTEARQLIEYSDEKNKRKNNWRHVLLSLSKPSFFNDRIFLTPEQKTWVYVSYKELGNAVESMLDYIEQISVDDAFFAREYARVCKTLHKIQEFNFDIDWVEGKYDFYDNEIHRSLLTIRLHDLYAKTQYTKIAAMFEEVLRNRRILGDGINLVLRAGAIPEPNTAFVNSGYTNTQGLAEIKLGLPVPGFKSCIGVQLQGGEIRLFFECESNRSAEKIATELLNRGLWFRFAEGIGQSKKGEFYRFKPAFFYLKKKIGHPLLPDLVDEVSGLVKLMVERRIEIANTVRSLKM